MEVKPGYKQTEVGVIPEEWEVAKIKEHTAIQTGKRNTQDRVEDGQYPLFVRSQTVERINSYAFDGEAVLTAGDGVGTGKVFHYIKGRFDYHQRVYKISNFSPQLSGQFFHLVFSTRFYDRIMSMTAKSSVDSVRLDMIADMQIPLPPIPEQRAIAGALSDLDALIGALDQLIAKKRDLKQAAMQQLLTGQERLPGFHGEWEKTTLGEIGECIIGLTYKPENVVEHGLLVLRASNIQNCQLSYEDNVYVNLEVPDHLVTRPGDILICVRNGSRALIGKCAMIDESAAGVTFGAFMSVYRTKHSRFIFHAFQADDLQRQIRENMGATINQITNKDLKAFRVKLPHEDEQTAIAEVLSDLDTELAALDQRRDKTRALKQGMMQELLTGRTRLVDSGKLRVDSKE
jgi:type I restriction enzyme S subunit